MEHPELKLGVPPEWEIKVAHLRRGSRMGVPNGGIYVCVLCVGHICAVREDKQRPWLRKKKSHKFPFEIF